MAGRPGTRKPVIFAVDDQKEGRLSGFGPPLEGIRDVGNRLSTE